MPDAYRRWSGMELSPKHAHKATLVHEMLVRFREVCTPISSHLRLECARLISALVGAVKYCMQLLLAASNAELRMLIARCDHNEMDFAVEHEPEKATAIPSLEVWNLVKVQIKMHRLILKAKTAQAKPSLMVVFESGDRLPLSVRSSLLEEDASLVFTAVYFIAEEEKEIHHLQGLCNGPFVRTSHNKKRYQEPSSLNQPFDPF